MKKMLQGVAFVVLLATFNLHFLPVFAQGTAFTYQGRLNDGGIPLTGLYDFRFKLFADPLGNTQVGANYFATNVPVASGLFATSIDFGAGLFNGSNYWLEVDVRTNNPANILNYTQLIPFQALTPVPYAVFATTASNVSGTISATQISGTVTSVSLSGTYGNAVTLNNAGNSFSGSFTGNGSALTSLSASNLTGTVPVSVLPAAVVTNTETGVTLAGAFSGDGAGLQNLIASTPGGINNASIGYASLQFNTGSYNTADGFHAMWENYSGSYNTAIGYRAFEQAGNLDGIGDENTAIGAQALYRQGTFFFEPCGSDNIAIGLLAGSAYAQGESTNIDIGNTGVAGENNVIHIGTSQTQTYIAGVINGNGGGLTNLNLSASQIVSGTLPDSVLAGFQSPFNTIAGGAQNTVGYNYSSIGGGQNNTASGEWSTIGGGQNNLATNFRDTVGGGYANAATGGESTIGGGEYNATAYLNCTVAGGESNSAVFYNDTVGGGFYNLATNNCATVSGGKNNIASGNYAAVPGGTNNAASGDYSFAAGDNAQAANAGAFVWADSSSPSPFASTNNNSFNIRASGGVRIATTSAGTVGALLAAGQTSWTTLSDRNAKKNFQPVNCQAVLDKLASVPIQKWNYKWEKDTDVPNLGPMAQDFKHAFYPGRDDKGISTLEFDGVELAAIEGLNEKVEGGKQQADAQMAKLEAENADLKARLEKLEQFVAQKLGGAN